MAHPHSSLVQQAGTINALALDTLAARVAILANTAFNNIQSPFLLKQVRYFVQMVGRTLADDGPVLIGVARGDATIAEIAAALLEGNTNGPEDLTETLTQDVIQAVYMNTVVPFVMRGDGTEGILDTKWINFGGKNGIPTLENVGFSVFAFNAGSGALTTGSSLNGIFQIRGVWLRG